MKKLIFLIKRNFTLSFSLLFDLLFKDSISKADQERLKQASKGLLSSLKDALRPMPDWTKNTSTQAEVKIVILDRLYQTLPRPPFTEPETEDIAAIAAAMEAVLSPSALMADAPGASTANVSTRRWRAQARAEGLR